MAKSLDLSSLTRAERVVFASAIALVVNGFIPWWYRLTTSRGTYTYNAGLTGYGVIAVSAAACVVIGVLARTNIWPEPAPRADGLIYAALGAIASVSILIGMADGGAEWIGSYVALALSLAITAAGYLRSRQRRAGWQ